MHRYTKHIAALGTLALVATAGAFSMAKPGVTCHTRGLLPDPVCTPGSINPNVTQANIHSTICVSGYTATIRPPVSYTAPLKLKQMAQYGVSGSASNFEEDHLIPLEAGGNPTDPKNLWPESAPGYHQKDAIENLIHKRICDGTITLLEGQRELSTDWTLIK